jgi:hypothetical protein
LCRTINHDYSPRKYEFHRTEYVVDRWVILRYINSNVFASGVHHREWSSQVCDSEGVISWIYLFCLKSVNFKFIRTVLRLSFLRLSSVTVSDCILESHETTSLRKF